MVVKLTVKSVPKWYEEQQEDLNQRREQEEQSEESTGAYLGRGALRTGARIGEAALGLGGDVLSGIGGLAHKLSGGRIPSYEQAQEKLPISLPTSADIRRGVTKKLTGEYLEPKDSGEEFVDQIVSDVTSLFAPGKINIPFAGTVGKIGKFLYSGAPRSLGRAAVMGVGSNAAGWMAEEILDSKMAGQAVKFGTLVALGIPKAKEQLKKEAKELYGKRDALLEATNPTVSSPELAKRARRLDKWSGLGVHDDVNRKQVFNIAKSLDRDIMTGNNIKVSDLIELKKDMGDAIRSKRITGDAIPQVIYTIKDIDKILADYGHVNQEFGMLHRTAEGIYSGIKNQGKVTKMIEDTIDVDKAIKSPITKFVLLGGSPQKMLLKAGASTALKGIKKASEMYDLVISNPTTRKYLGQVYKNAIKENKSGLLRAVKNLDVSVRHYNR